MEVTPAGGPCGCHFRGFHEVGTLQRLLTPDRHNSPFCVSSSRGPVPKSPTRNFVSSGFYKSEELKQNDGPSRTLEGVLRGQVPSLFTDLCRSSPHSDNSWSRQQNSPPTAVPTRIGSLSSPRSSTSSIVTPYSLKRTYSEVVQDEPIDLSCKKMRSDLNRPNSHMDISTMESCFGNSTLHQQYSLRSPSPQNDSSTAGQKGPSLLRNLLCLGKDLDSSQYNNRSDRSLQYFNGGFPIKTENSFSSGYDPDSRCQNTLSPLHPHNRLTPNIGCIQNKSGGLMKVTLAKKNMLPVSARVSDWLVKIIRFAKSIPEFSTMLHTDKLALVLNSWARLLLLYMAEHNFQFAVTPDQNADPSPTKIQCPENTGNQEEPTMKSVESVQTFIRKCQNMGTDSKEYAFLRMAVLFNAGIRGLDRPDMVDRVNSSVQQLLQQHVQASRPRDFMHYSRLLMSLPALYGINCKMIENLFCRHINGNMDMDVLLKEMLQNI